MRVIPENLKNLLAEYGISTRFVFAFGDETYEVPRHINKLPNGWQVRFDRKEEKYFSQSFNNKNFTSYEATLDAAIKCLVVAQKNHTPTDCLISQMKDFPKISFAKSLSKHNTIRQFSASVTIMKTKESGLIVESRYLGTTKTTSNLKIEKAVKELYAIWFWAKSIKAGYGRQKLREMYSNIPKNVMTYLPDGFVPPQYNVDTLHRLASN
ncbi:hypothetical protein LMH73_027875 [Vibrio splendidus]|nr:hypothetical protein [Vibrio splendidus]MCC4882489.1 hypothetical protein [Vibrio splendidus]